MQSSFPKAPLLIAVTVLLTAGLVHGFWTNRWQQSGALEEAVSRLPSVPLQAGPWQGTDVTVDPEPFRQARAAGYWLRNFNREGGPGTMTVILMCGQAGHMSVHTPDICYRGAGFEMISQPHKQAIEAGSPDGKDEFWTARFRQGARNTGAELRIFWAWGTGPVWQAPESPRWALGDSAFLYKLYIVHETNDPTNAAQDTADFLKEFIPVLRKSLNSSTPPQP